MGYVVEPESSSPDGWPLKNAIPKLDQAGVPHQDVVFLAMQWCRGCLMSVVMSWCHLNRDSKFMRVMRTWRQAIYFLFVQTLSGRFFWCGVVIIWWFK